MAIALVKDGIKAKNNYTKKKNHGDGGQRRYQVHNNYLYRAVNVWELENLPQLQLSKFNIWIYN